MSAPQNSDTSVSSQSAGMCYVGLKACGCAVAAAVDRPDLAKDNAKHIANWMRNGLTIERKPVEWVRENLMRCTHAARVSS